MIAFVQGLSNRLFEPEIFLRTSLDYLLSCRLLWHDGNPRQTLKNGLRITAYVSIIDLLGAGQSYEEHLGHLVLRSTHIECRPDLFF